MFEGAWDAWWPLCYSKTRGVSLCTRFSIVQRVSTGTPMGRDIPDDDR